MEIDAYLGIRVSRQQDWQSPRPSVAIFPLNNAGQIYKPDASA